MRELNHAVATFAKLALLPLDKLEAVQIDRCACVRRLGRFALGFHELVHGVDLLHQTGGEPVLSLQRYFGDLRRVRTALRTVIYIT